MSEVRCAMACRSFICCTILICHDVYLVRHSGSCYGICYVSCRFWCAIHSFAVLSKYVISNMMSDVMDHGMAFVLLHDMLASQ